MTCRVSTRAAHPVPWWSCVCVTAVCVTALLLVATPGLGVAFQHRQLECRPASDSTRRQDAWALTLDRSSAANDQPQCRKTNKLPHALYMLYTSLSALSCPKVGTRSARASLQARGVTGERWGHRAWSRCRITRAVSPGSQPPSRRCRRRPRPRCFGRLVPNWNAC